MESICDLDEEQARVQALSRWVLSLGRDDEAARQVVSAYSGHAFADSVQKAIDAAVLDRREESENDFSQDLNEDSAEVALLRVARELPWIIDAREQIVLNAELREEYLARLDQCIARLAGHVSLEPVIAWIHSTVGILQNEADPRLSAMAFAKAATLQARHHDWQEPSSVQAWSASAYNHALVCIELHRLTEASASLRVAFNLRVTLYRRCEDGAKRDLALTHDAIGQLRQAEECRVRAVRHYRRAIALLRPIATNAPEEGLELLAGSLNNLGNVTAEAHRPDEALPCYREALGIYETLARQAPDIYTVDVGMARHNLGDVLADLGHLGDSIHSFEIAREIREQLAGSEEPGALGDLAQTLDGLGTLYTEHRRYKSAADALEKALGIRRMLAERDPEVYERALCRTLLNCGNLLHDRSRHEAASTMFEEAECRLESLIEDEGEDNGVLSMLATLRMNASTLYRERSLFDQARTAAVKSISTFRTLLMRAGDEYRDDLATALNNLALLEQTMRQLPAARVALEESLAITRVLVNESPVFYQSDLARTALNMAVLHYTTCNWERAYEAALEALTIYRDLAAVDPDRFEPNVGNAAMNLGLVSLERNESIGAIALFQEAQEIFQRLTEIEPDVYRPELARVLLNLVSVYVELERDDDVARTIDAALSLHESLVREHGEPWFADHAMMHANAGVWCERRGEPSSASYHFCTAVDLAERAGTDEHIFVAKGEATVAYRRLIANHIETPNEAFRFAAALREPSIRAFGDYPSTLADVQHVLAEATSFHGTEHYLLMPTADLDEEKMTLGLISSCSERWHMITCPGWAELGIPASGVAAVRRRKALASMAWKALPGDVREIFRCTAQQATVLISADPLWSVFPWELLFDDQSDEGFLGLRHPLPRVEAGSAETLTHYLKPTTLGAARPRAVVLAANMTDGPILRAAEVEAKAACQAVTARGGQVIAFAINEKAHLEFLREALARNPDLIYFCGHGTIVDEEELLVLAGEAGSPPALFGTDELERLAVAGETRPLLGHAPLVVLSSCMSGARRQFGGLRQDLVGRFLHHGAGSVIATALPVDDTVSARFGRAIIAPDDDAGTTIAARVLAARRLLAGDPQLALNSLVWGSWGRIHLHGAPHAVFAPADDAGAH